MAQKIVTLVGATGTQGSAIISSLFGNPEYKIRGLTRNPDSAAAQNLRAKGIEIVQADLEDPASLRAAFAGSYAVFGVTDMPGMVRSGADIEVAIAAETKLGVNIAQACIETPGLEHFIWSTLPDIEELSNGAFDLPNFRGKVAVDKFIRTHAELTAKTTFLFIAQYHKNWNFPALTPHPIAGSGGAEGEMYVQLATHPPETPITTIGNVRRNLGPFVAAVLAQPEKTRGATVLAHVEIQTAEESMQTWAKARGVRVISVPTSIEQHEELFGTFSFLGLMWRSWGALGDRSWSQPSGEKVLTKDDLGVTGLVSLADSFRDSFQNGVW